VRKATIRTRLTENGTESAVRGGRGGREAGTVGVKVATIGTGRIEGKEMETPRARGAGVICVCIPRWGQMRRKTSLTAEGLIAQVKSRNA
jgi:hypothetical protein